MTSFIQLLGSDVPDSYGGCCLSTLLYSDLFLTPEEKEAAAASLDPPLLYRKEEEKYLCFNCPEGVQRFSSEASIRLNRIKCFLFTRCCGVSKKTGRQEDDENENESKIVKGAASAVMGLPGLLFTVNDAGVHQAFFSGPSSSTFRSSSSLLSSSVGQGVGEVPVKEIVHHTHAKEENEVSGGLGLDSEDQGGISSLSSSPSSMFGVERLLHRTQQHYFRFRKMRMFEVGWVPIMIEPTCPGGRSGGGDPSFLSFWRMSSRSIIFRVRTSKGNALDECVYSYLIVDAPSAVFDAALAKQHGVPPGPLFSLLKNGVPVELRSNEEGEANGKTVGAPAVGGKRDRMEDMTSTTGTSAAAAPSHRPAHIVHPDSVLQPSVASSAIYCTWILDSNSPKDLQCCLEALMMPPKQEADKVIPSLFIRTLHTVAPELLYTWSSLAAYRQRHATNTSTADFIPLTASPLSPPLECRAVVLRRVVHLQPASYFSPLNTDTFAPPTLRVYRRYAQSLMEPFFSFTMGSLSESLVFSLPQHVGRSHRCPVRHEVAYRYDLPHFTEPNSRDGEVVVQHLFTSLTYAHFTAFPTALVHRLHLHLLSTACFPVRPTVAVEEGEKRERTTSTDVTSPQFWPYACRYRNIPLADTKISHSHGVRSSSPSSSSSNMSLRIVDDLNRLIRYPSSLDEATCLLSASLQAKIAAVRDSLAHSTSKWEEFKDSPGVAFTGTGSAVPSKYRNVSGAYVQCFTAGEAPKRVIAVLDWGEGSCGQLIGIESNLGAFLRDLSIVFISHGHADHHFGLLTLLELRHLYQVHTPCVLPPVVVVCPKEVLAWWRETWISTEPYSTYIFKECVFDVLEGGEEVGGMDSVSSAPQPCALMHLQAKLAGWNDEARRRPLPNTEEAEGWAAEVFPVAHPSNAHALLLRFPWDISASTGSAVDGLGRTIQRRTRVMLFSGDTRPCASIVERTTHFLHRGERLFLCLHEATFGPGFEQEAAKKSHSTLAQALHTGFVQLHADYVLLNHFSQRYPKLPDISTALQTLGAPGEKEGQEEEKAALSQRLQFAFDGMTLRWAMLPHASSTQLLSLALLLLEEYESWPSGTTARMRGPSASLLMEKKE